MSPSLQRSHARLSGKAGGGMSVLSMYLELCEFYMQFLYSRKFSLVQIFARIPFPLEKKFSRLVGATDHASLSSPGYRGPKISRGRQ